MRIALHSLLVDDQDRALAFYTEVVGFEKKRDIPLGEFRFISVTSPAGPEGAELVLEPNVHPAARAYQRAIYSDGIPATTFLVDDVQAEHRRLAEAGVEFKTPPTETGMGTFAVFDDGCGNLVQIHQE